MEDEDHAIRALGDGEEIAARVQAGEISMVVTDRRLAIGSRERLIMDLPIERLRRIQFDIERRRPATLVVVPEYVSDEPQVLMVPPEDYRGVAQALAIVGERLAELE